MGEAIGLDLLYTFVEEVRFGRSLTKMNNANVKSGETDTNMGDAADGDMKGTLYSPVCVNV